MFVIRLLCSLLGTAGLGVIPDSNPDPDLISNPNFPRKFIRPTRSQQDSSFSGEEER